MSTGWNSQDWALYIICPSIELALGKPLTFTEISEYLKLLPDDISRERKVVITYALQSVGKIPYYYGGKAKAPGYEGNNFAVITPPDRKGRIISGLDCSGWVNWVYWSSLGKILTNLGTSGLIYAGRAVSRSDLKPGDIIIKTGGKFPCRHVPGLGAERPDDMHPRDRRKRQQRHGQCYGCKLALLPFFIRLR